MIKNRRWFDAGAEAFSRNWPSILSHSGGPYYFCPLCLTGFSERDLQSGRLSVEHVPAESVGGRPLCLTCKACNDHFGHSVEPHVREHEDWYQFLVGGEVASRKATLTVGPHEVPVRFSADRHHLKAFVEERAAPPQVAAGALESMAEFQRSAPDDFEMKLSLGAYDPALVATGWVKSAVLAYFAALGYSFVVREEMQQLRRELRAPAADARQVRAAYRFLPKAKPQRRGGQLLIVDSPEALRSFLFRWGPHQVLLPRFGDSTLYDRLAVMADTSDQATVREVPWPVRPSHRWDKTP